MIVTTDTMSEFSVTMENVWQYYEKVSDYEAKCWLCGQKYFYVNCSYFHGHIIQQHPEIVKYEKKCGRQEWPWICFKYTYNNTSISECLFCSENFKSNVQSLAEHLNRKHFSQVKNYVYYDWIWKYCMRTVDDFKAKCICNSEYDMPLNNLLHQHIKFKHSKELRNVQETREIVLSSESVWNSKVTEIKENMWKYYIKIQPSRVKCKFCVYNWSYMHFLSKKSILHNHIKDRHKKTFKWETYKKNEEKPPWSYYYQFMFDREIMYLKCLICRNLFSFQSAENHLNNHSKEDIEVTNALSDNWSFKHYQHNQSDEHSKDIAAIAINASDDWIIKYYTQCRDGDKMKCNICYKNIKIEMIPHVFNHTIEMHSEELQRNISKKESKKLWQNYINLRNFQARCKLCDFQSYYIDTRNFSKHVNEKHEKINKYEEEHGKRWPFKFFKYYNKNSLQCCLCTLLLASEDERKLTEHLNYEHFFEQPYHFIDGWIWKYCTKIGDFEVECSVCTIQSKISLDIRLWYFNNHTKNKHPNQQYIRTQRPLDVAGPSENQSN